MQTRSIHMDIWRDTQNITVHLSVSVQVIDLLRDTTPCSLAHFVRNFCCRKPQWPLFISCHNRVAMAVHKYCDEIFVKKLNNKFINAFGPIRCKKF